MPSIRNSTLHPAKHGGLGPGGGGYLPPDIFSMDFSGMTATGPTTFTGPGGTVLNPYGGGIVIAADPTAEASGNVADIIYSPSAGSSHDNRLEFTFATPLRYNQTIWTRARYYLKSSTDAGYTPDDNRKMLAFYGDGVDIVLTRQIEGAPHNYDGLRLIGADWTGGTQVNRVVDSCNHELLANTWLTVETMFRTNSANGVFDGRYEIYFNGASTPDFVEASNWAPITEDWGGVGHAPSNWRVIAFGTQLTISGATAYTEHRYLKKLAISTTRIGP